MDPATVEAERQILREKALAEGKPEKIAAKTARVFLGVQLDCAECHDHPFDDWSQQDFWGFAAYFAQLSTGAEQPVPTAGQIAVAASGGDGRK